MKKISEQTKNFLLYGIGLVFLYLENVLHANVKISEEEE